MTAQDPQASTVPRSFSADSELALMMKGYGLTTASILYHLPDHPALLQTFVWQTYDLAPKFPRLEAFLAFWKAEIEGRLHSVQVAHRRLIGPGVWRHVDREFSLH